MPLVTILTRVHPVRPRCLARNIKSVEEQTDHDLQHLLLRPEVEPHDVIKVGPLIHYAGPQITGRYVMQLPDDDRLRLPTFVADLRAVIETKDPDMIIFRMAYGDAWICPPDDMWAARAIECGYIAGQNAIVRRKIYDGASHEWLRLIYEADFHYLTTAHRLSQKVFWWDYVGVESQGQAGNNAGKPEAEIKVKPHLVGE